MNLSSGYPLFVVFLLVVLAVPPGLERGSWKRFFIALPLSLVGILLPLFVFVFSAALAPEWKGGCESGWIDCFHEGKMSLLPLVLWATAALYAKDILAVKNSTHSWIVLGILFGATVSGVCLIYGLWMFLIKPSGIHLWLIVPLYVFLWYSIHAVSLIRTGKVPLTTRVIAVLSSVPFWIASILWSKKIYDELPNNPPHCFIVTAASCGHKNFVGPFVEVPHHGRKQQANRQLAVLWRFEEFWREQSKGSHAAFRCIYNRLGPKIARRINSPVRADIIYVAIKPAEFLAAVILKIADKKN